MSFLFKYRSRKFRPLVIYFIWIFFFLLTKTWVYGYPTRKHSQILIQTYIEDHIPYSRNFIYQKEISKQTSEPFVRYQELINFQPSKSWKETLPHCGNTRVRMWLEILHFHLPAYVIKGFAEECIRLTSLKVSEPHFKKIEKKILQVIHKWKIHKLELAPIGLEENVEKKFQELKKEWEDLAFYYSNLHSGMEPNVRKKSHYMELAKINHKIIHLMENTLFNPIDSEEDKIFQIHKILKDIERLKKRRITQMIRNVEIPKTNVLARNEKLLHYFQEILKTWNSNPRLQPYQDTGTQVIHCFQGWDEEKKNLYSLDYFINFFEDYHSYHSTIRERWKPEEQEVLDNFHHILYDSYLFPNRLEAVLKICEKISKN